MGFLGKQAAFETIRSIDSATFTGSYQTLGTPLTNGSCLAFFFNNSGVLVTFSDDGVHDKFVLPSGAGIVFDFGSDAQSRGGDAQLLYPANTQIWVKGSASTGLVYFSTIYPRSL